MFFELLALSSEQWAWTRYLRNVFALLIAHCPLLITQSRRRCKPYDLTTPKYTPKGGIQGWGRANNDEHVFFYDKSRKSKDKRLRSGGSQL